MMAERDSGQLSKRNDGVVKKGNGRGGRTKPLAGLRSWTSECTQHSRSRSVKEGTRCLQPLALVLKYHGEIDT